MLPKRSGFDKLDAVNTIFYFEVGAILASMSWGYISDKLNGRRAAVAVACMVAIIFVVMLYRNATSVMMVNISLFFARRTDFRPSIADWHFFGGLCA